jgi:hypothetical protein
MVIFGDWRVCDDGVTRPTLLAKVQNANGQFLAEVFLIDTGADRTVLSAELCAKLKFQSNTASEIWPFKASAESSILSPLRRQWN